MSAGILVGYALHGEADNTPQSIASHHSLITPVETTFLANLFVLLANPHPYLLSQFVCLRKKCNTKNGRIYHSQNQLWRFYPVVDNFSVHHRAAINCSNFTTLPASRSQKEMQLRLIVIVVRPVDVLRYLKRKLNFIHRNNLH